jgi:hypothetical protein
MIIAGSLPKAIPPNGGVPGVFMQVGSLRIEDWWAMVNILKGSSDIKSPSNFSVGNAEMTGLRSIIWVWDPKACSRILFYYL